MQSKVPSGSDPDGAASEATLAELLRRKEGPGIKLVELLLEPGIKLVSRVPKLDCRSGAIDLVEGGTAAALPTPGSPDALSSAAFACLRAHIDCPPTFRGADGAGVSKPAGEGFDPGLEPASNEPELPCCMETIRSRTDGPSVPERADEAFDPGLVATPDEPLCWSEANRSRTDAVLVLLLLRRVMRRPKLDCRTGWDGLAEEGGAAALPNPGSISSAAFACLRAHIDCRGADGPGLPEHADEGFDPGFEPASNELL